MLQTFIHYGLHLLAPGLIAFIFFRDNWMKAWGIMILTMLVDLDHLFAYPDVFVTNRCSIGFHPLHTYWAAGVYFLLLFPKKTRIIAVGLLFHLLTDGVDCWMMGVSINELFPVRVFGPET